MAESNGNGSNVGRVEQVTGVVIDAVFPDELPEIFSAVTIETSGGDWDRLAITVDDPDATAAQVREAAGLS